jgi:hypothetical protein
VPGALSVGRGRGRAHAAGAVLAVCAGLATAAPTGVAVAAAAPAATVTQTRAAALSQAGTVAVGQPSSVATTAVIAPSLIPDRLGARAALAFTIRYAGGEFGVPSPVRRSVVQFPAGLSLDIPSLRSCTAARLLARGANGCPARSQLGGGHALAEVHAGSQTISEDVALSTFLGPPQNGEPVFEILGQGYTPFDERVVLAGTVLPDSAPYGEELVMSIPPIPTLPFEPVASIVSLSLTVGAGGRGQRTPAKSTFVVPASCPVGGFPFAAEFSYADGSSGSALATAPCPASPPALAAETALDPSLGGWPTGAADS